MSNVTLLCHRKFIGKNGNKQANHDNNSVRIILPSFIYHISCSFSWNILGAIIQPRQNIFSLTAAVLHAKLPDLKSSVYLLKKKIRLRRTNKSTEEYVGSKGQLSHYRTVSYQSTHYSQYMLNFTYSKLPNESMPKGIRINRRFYI